MAKYKMTLQATEAGMLGSGCFNPKYITGVIQSLEKYPDKEIWLKKVPRHKAVAGKVIRFGEKRTAGSAWAIVFVPEISKLARHSGKSVSQRLDNPEKYVSGAKSDAMPQQQALSW